MKTFGPQLYRTLCASSKESSPPDGIDALILDLYDEVEQTYRHLPDGARRDKCREWGLTYEGDPHAPAARASGSARAAGAVRGRGLEYAAIPFPKPQR